MKVEYNKNKVFVSNGGNSYDGTLVLMKLIKTFKNISDDGSINGWPVFTAFEIDWDKCAVTVFGGYKDNLKANPRYLKEDVFVEGYDPGNTKSASDLDKLIDSDTDFGCRKDDVRKVIEFILAKLDSKK